MSCTTFELDDLLLTYLQAGSHLHFQGHPRRSRSLVKVHSHGMESVVKVDGVTSIDGFLVVVFSPPGLHFLS